MTDGATNLAVIGPGRDGRVAVRRRGITPAGWVGDYWSVEDAAGASVFARVALEDDARRLVFGGKPEGDR